MLVASLPSNTIEWEKIETGLEEKRVNIIRLSGIYCFVEHFSSFIKLRGNAFMGTRHSFVYCLFITKVQNYFVLPDGIAIDRQFS